MKVCRTCDVSKSDDDFRKGGRVCKKCKYAADRVRLQSRPDLQERVRQNTRAYVERNRDKVLTKAAEHRAANREAIRERNRQDKAAKRANAEENAKLKEAHKRWADKNREYVTEKNKAYYQENKETFKANVKAYLAANPDKQKAWAQNYRARKRSAGLVTGAEIRAILGPAEVCFYCEEPFGSKVKTVDHIIPLCQGGENAVWNLVPCCKSCNSTKRHRTPAQWGAPRVGMARLNEKLAEHLSQHT